MSEETSPALDPASKSAAPHPTGPFLSWPPPGLEQIQGRLGSTTAFLFLGAAVLVLPLLVSIGTEQSFTSLGVFGPAGWIVAVTTACGLVLLVEGFRRFFMILRTGNRAVQQGHGWLTVLQAAADGPRDTGFLLQGARLYAGLDAAGRELLLRRRLTADTAALAAALWLLFGFVLGVFGTARGILGPTGLWWFILFPIALLLLAAALERFGAGLRTRKLRRRTREEVRRTLTDQVNSWRSQAAVFELPGVLGSGGPGRMTPLRIVAAITSIVGLILLVPIVTFTFMGTFMPLHLNQVMPRFQGVQEKAIEVEYLRPYHLATDPAITPRAAGVALVNLNFTGSTEAPDPLLKPPAVRYEQPWRFGRNMSRGRTALALLEKATADLTLEERELLRSEARHPAHAEFATLARAGSADFAGTYWQLPLPDSLAWFELPIPRFQRVMDGAKAHIARAAWELHLGQRTQAETTIREVISCGLLLLDEHPTLIGNLIGIVMAQTGGNALESFYRAVGRTIEADRLQAARDGIEQTLDRSSSYFYDRPTPEYLEIMADIVMDRKMMRGLRWEFVPFIATGASFTNLNRAVFGPGEGYAIWLQQAHDELVRHPGEEELFERMELGFLVSPSSLERRGFIEWLLGLTFGKSRTPGSFAALIRAIE